MIKCVLINNSHCLNTFHIIVNRRLKFGKLKNNYKKKIVSNNGKNANTLQ